ncbi:MAG: chemotaxis response regulator protein-glutamate methylesterase [Pseudomonadota bacterium]|jgi:two-component system chemotaxis response regulator CheB|nr:MAG: chemotaxis response regulator protein-glutamate methylesterase [Pseudomonadota bacterium]
MSGPVPACGTSSTRAVRVLVVDDSALVRRVLTDLLSSDPGIEVVGAAGDAYAARERIKSLAPDVLTLDIEMPRMDGLTFLRRLMRLRPMPVVMISSLAEHGAEVTLEALSIGAVDYLPKPTMDIAAGLAAYREELLAKIRMAARARVRPWQEPGVAEGPAAPAPVALQCHRRFRTTEKIIAIGASTGGTEAIRAVLQELPADTPGVVVTQHIPRAFSAAFAHRVNGLCRMQVCEAQDGQQILPGHVYIAPGDQHLTVTRSGARYHCRLDGGSPVNRHRPSVDVLFRSVARNAGPNAIGVILTGMGRDGAQGLKEMHEAGSPTLAQDEDSSVVWGMPRAAVECGAVDEVLPLARIATRVLALAAAMDETKHSHPGVCRVVETGGTGT